MRTKYAQLYTKKESKPNQYTDNKKCNHIHSLHSVYYLTILYLACVKQLHNLFFKRKNGSVQ